MVLRADMKRYTGIAAAVLWIVSVAAGVPPVHSEGVPERFTVTREGVGLYYADIVSKSAEKSFDAIVDMLGHRPSTTIEIILTAARPRFEDLTEHALPDWSSAAALPGNRIVISPLDGRKIDVERIVAHEIVHCVIDDAAGGAYVPRWFHEGFAELLSGELGVSGRARLFHAVLNKRLMSFYDIERVFTEDAEGATLAYDQSLLAARMLIENHSRGVASAILSSMNGGDEFEVSFNRATGLTEADFEAAYLLRVKSVYGWRSLVTFIPGTWTAILLLAFLAYAATKLRTRRIMREWEHTDRPRNIVDFEPLPPDGVDYDDDNDDEA